MKNDLRLYWSNEQRTNNLPNIYVQTLRFVNGNATGPHAAVHFGQPNAKLLQAIETRPMEG